MGLHHGPSGQLEDMVVPRCMGALLGTALGDAIGAPFEGAPLVSRPAVLRWADGQGALRWTDDTHMTIGVAESLLACDGVDGAHMARRFCELHAAEPDRGYGAGPPRVFAAIRDGARWDLPALDLFEGGSYGNGAAMRAAPIGLWGRGDVGDTVALAHEQARITHAHELAKDAAAVQACLVGVLAHDPPEDVDDVRRRVRGLLRAVPVSPAFRRRLDVLEDLDADADGDEVVAALGNGVAAVEAVPAALHTFLRSPGDFCEVVVQAVALGGDADTIAAMAGALAGAWLGAGAIPSRWLDRLEDRDHMERLAHGLAQRRG